MSWTGTSRIERITTESFLYIRLISRLIYTIRPYFWLLETFRADVCLSIYKCLYSLLGYKFDVWRWKWESFTPLSLWRNTRTSVENSVSRGGGDFSSVHICQSYIRILKCFILRLMHANHAVFMYFWLNTQNYYMPLTWYCSHLYKCIPVSWVTP